MRLHEVAGDGESQPAALYLSARHTEITLENALVVAGIDASTEIPHIELYVMPVLLLGTNGHSHCPSSSPADISPESSSPCCPHKSSTVRISSRPNRPPLIRPCPPTTFVAGHCASLSLGLIFPEQLLASG